MNILLGVTGSVAATLTPKLAAALKELGDVNIVLTNPAQSFASPTQLRKQYGLEVFTEKDEWTWQDTFQGGQTVEREYYHKNDEVLHIELRKWADVLVIAPLSANTLAKMTYGLCDNLLTSIYRAWDWNKQIVVAPSMNTMMWENSPTPEQIRNLRSEVKVCRPISKELACGDTGEGAMARIEDIVEKVKRALYWEFPLGVAHGIPIGNHPGAFGFKRKRSHHCGVDLYTQEGASVYAVESGRVVGIEHFTGPQDTTPWYENTDAILIEGKSGVVCYGEIMPRGSQPQSWAAAMSAIKVGDWVHKGQVVGFVTPVIPAGREQTYPGWSRSMLHLELYKHGTKECCHRWELDSPMWDYLIDPTPFLLSALPKTNCLVCYCLPPP